MTTYYYISKSIFTILGIIIFLKIRKSRNQNTKQQNIIIEEKQFDLITAQPQTNYELNRAYAYGTKNMFIESHYELNISLFEKELTADIINAAYIKLLNEHVASIQKGIEPSFNILVKQEARDYLIKSLDKLIKE